jgi:hypothetical protein
MNVLSLAEVLEPYRTTSIATAVDTNIQNVSRWKGGLAFPAPDKWKPLAAFLKEDVAIMFERHEAFQSRQVA